MRRICQTPALFMPRRQKYMDIAVATHQPIGHASHIPVESERRAGQYYCKRYPEQRSVNVDAINCFIRPEPRSTPSATSFADTTI